MKKKSNPIKECLQYNISVEGINWELLYFEHLKKLINECEKAKKECNISSYDLAYSNYTKIDEYKAVAEFTKILSSIALDDVITAVKRGHVIRNNHINNKDHIEAYKKFNFYRDNPDMTIHIIVEKILEECKII